MFSVLIRQVYYSLTEFTQMIFEVAPTFRACLLFPPTAVAPQKAVVPIRSQRRQIDFYKI
jgi:hypothetical protein